MPDTPDAVPKLEAINQMVRAFSVCLLLLTFCAVFLWGVWRERAIVDVAAFVSVLQNVVTWWFKSRDDQQRRTDMRNTTTTTTRGRGKPTVTKTVTGTPPSTGG